METNKLIKDALNRLCSEWESCAPERMLFALAAVDQISRFDTLCATKDWSTGVEDVFQEAIRPPKRLRKTDYEGYANFVYDLMKAGPLYGMAHEDPLGVNVLVGGALSLYRKLVIEQNQHTLLPKTLDLMLLQSVAYMNAGARDLARMQLMSIVDLTADIQEDDSDRLLTLLRTDNGSISRDILIRAAPAAFMLSSIFKYEQDEKRANASMLLAKTLFSEALEKGEAGFPGNRTEMLMAMLALSELALYQGEKMEGLDTLDRAIWIVNDDKDVAAKDGVYFYVVSVANQRRAQIFMVQEDLDSAQEHYSAAVSYARMAYESSPVNIHYHDHYAGLLNELGILYGVRGDLLRAQDTFLLAIDERKVLTAQSNQYNEQLVACLNNMSTLMRNHNNREVALVYLEEALEVAETTEIDPELADQMKELVAQMKKESTTFNPSPTVGPN